MSWSRRRALLALAGLPALLAGCGFRPLYGGPRSAGVRPSEELAAVLISPLRDRNGQILHNSLRDRLNPRGQPAQPRYRLDVQLAESTTDLGVRLDETATRARFQATAAYTLVRLSDGATLTRATAVANVSYNLLDNEFATFVSEQDARERALVEVADEIDRRLASYFRTQAAAG